MKKIFGVVLLLALVAPTYGGVFKHGIKPIAKAAVFPFVHSKKFVQGLGRGSKKAVVASAKGVKKVAD